MLGYLLTVAPKSFSTQSLALRSPTAETITAESKIWQNRENNGWTESQYGVFPGDRSRGALRVARQLLSLSAGSSRRAS